MKESQGQKKEAYWSKGHSHLNYKHSLCAHGYLFLFMCLLPWIIRCLIILSLISRAPNAILITNNKHTFTQTHLQWNWSLAHKPLYTCKHDTPDCCKIRYDEKNYWEREAQRNDGLDSAQQHKQPSPLRYVTTQSDQRLSTRMAR